MSRFVSVIYCDDIRNEVGNKQSFIGIYRSELYVADFPVVLPKLCIVINVQTSGDQPFKSLKLRILNFDDQIAEAVLPPEALAGQQAEAVASATPPGADGFLVCSMAVVLSPLKVDKPMRLRIRVDADGTELKGPALGIDRIPQQATLSGGPSKA